MTVTSRVPPAAGNRNEDGVTPVGVLGQATRATRTEMLRPPMVTVPDCPARPEGAVTVTLPPADTVDGVAVIHVRLSRTGQLQPAGPVTDRRRVPPTPGKLNDDGDTLVGDDGQPETCDTETERPPIVTVPFRAGPAFRPAWTRTEAPPDTLDGVVIQLWSSLTDQLQ